MSLNVIYNVLIIFSFYIDDGVWRGRGNKCYREYTIRYETILLPRIIDYNCVVGPDNIEKV